MTNLVQFNSFLKLLTRMSKFALETNALDTEENKTRQTLVKSVNHGHRKAHTNTATLQRGLPMMVLMETIAETQMVVAAQPSGATPWTQLNSMASAHLFKKLTHQMTLKNAVVMLALATEVGKPRP